VGVERLLLEILVVMRSGLLGKVYEKIKIRPLPKILTCNFKIFYW
jgi:hypothetical protein